MHLFQPHSQPVDHRSSCPADFCRFFSTLDFDINSKDFETRIFPLLKKWTHGSSTSGFPEAGGDILLLSIGSKRQLKQRNDCSSCRFFYSIAKEVDLDASRDDTGLYSAISKDSMPFNLWFLPDPAKGMFEGDVKNCDCTITFVSDTSSHSSAGRIFDYDSPDIERVHNWIESCNDISHKKCFELTVNMVQKTLPSSLRVFDVEKSCLVEIPWDEKYVTLSYVWGDAHPPKLFKAVLDDYMRPNALSTLIETFPATIKDAITLVRKLKLHYFWFDSLCLIQDDPEDLQLAIRNMDVVYGHAYLTIIAANSASANNQISGISKSRSKRQQTGRIKPGLELVKLNSLEFALRNSKWGTRGWTLQERYLSRRMLILANDQIYFLCRTKAWSEDTWNDCCPNEEDSGVINFNNIVASKESMDSRESPLAFYEFLKMTAQEFQNRNLTVDGDAVNAMSGLLGSIRQHIDSRIVQGNIVAILPALLLFVHHVSFGQAVKPDGIPRRRFDFPSWSWAGWNSSSVDFEFHNWSDSGMSNEKNEHVLFANWLRKSNWIYWYTSDNGSPPELLHDPCGSSQLISSLGPPPPQPRQWYLFSWISDLIAKGQCCIRRNRTPSYDRIHQKDDTADAEELDSENLLIQFLPDYTPEEYKHQPELPVPRKNYTILVFFTLTMPLRFMPSRTGLFRDLDLQDGKGRFCGRVVVDLPVSDPLGLGTFILLSQRPRLFSDTPGDPPWDLGWKNGEILYWVMLIEWVDDVYERRGIGVVNGFAIECPCPPGWDWKEIHLG